MKISNRFTTALLWLFAAWNLVVSIALADGDLQGGGGGPQALKNAVAAMEELSKGQNIVLDRIVDRDGNLFVISKTDELFLSKDKGTFEGEGGPQKADLILDFETKVGESTHSLRILGVTKPRAAFQEIPNINAPEISPQLGKFSNIQKVPSGGIAKACLVAIFPENCSCSEEYGRPVVKCQ